MSRGELPAVLRDVQTLFHQGTLHGLTDAQLLDRFRSEPAPGAELAFAGLVARHGSLVLGVCRRALRDPNDVADAFQATFLVLVRKAESVQARDSLGRWLYGVSRRVAVRARRTAAQRAARETDDVESLAGRATETPVDDLAAVLDEEIGKLPAKYRDAVVLCDLEGRTQDEAARRLGCAVGTVKSRLSRGRDRLRTRLIRRGVAPAAVGTTGVFSREILAAEVPSALAEATVKAAIDFAAAPVGAAGIVSARVGDLTQGAIRAMSLTRVQLTLSAMTTLFAMATGIGVMAMQDAAPRGGDESGTQQKQASSSREPADSPAAVDKTADDETLTEKEKEEQLDRIDALQIDIELLSVEIASIKSRLSSIMQMAAAIDTFGGRLEGRDAVPPDESVLEKRRAAALERRKLSQAMIMELRESFLTKSQEMRRKQRELDALFERQSGRPSRSHLSQFGLSRSPAPSTKDTQRPATTEQRLSEIERRLDEIIRLLGQLKDKP